MTGRYEDSTRRFGRRAVVATAAAAVAAASSAALLAAGPASAAPRPNYHPGQDRATFTVNGVLDGNCLVSVGGTEVWIKPGDSIKFGSSLAGISVSDAVAGKRLGGLLGGLLAPSQVAGLNVSAVIDPGKSSQRRFSVKGGTTTVIRGLSGGNHRLNWSASSLELVPGLSSTTIPLSSSSLKSGAKMSWSGVVRVTKDAPNCKISIATPKTQISAGPVKVTVPPVKVNVPGVKLPKVKLPSLGNLVPKSKKAGSSNSGSTSRPSSGLHYSPYPVTVPERVVPRGGGIAGSGGGDGGAYNGVLPAGTQGGVAALPSNGSGASGAKNGSNPSAAAANSPRTVDLATSVKSPSAQLPVILAIIAVLALALVAGVYARLYLLRRAQG